MNIKSIAAVLVAIGIGYQIGLGCIATGFLAAGLSLMTMDRN